MSTGRIGIIGAMDAEVAHLKASLKDPRSEEHAGIEFCTGKLGATDVVVVQCGVGKVNAAACAQTLVLHFEVSAVINTGAAGSLDARIGIDDIVVSSGAVQHDFDATALGYPPGEICGMKTTVFEADDGLRTMARTIIGAVSPHTRVFEGIVASGDRFVSAASEKERIVSQFEGACCCEMEGAAIAQVCTLSHVPFVIIRAISDAADEPKQEDYPAFEERAAQLCARVVEAFVRRLQE